MNPILRLLPVVAAVTVVLQGCASSSDASCGEAPTASDGEPRDVAVLGENLSPVAEAFNAQADRWRVVAVVSPTCSECLLGAEAVRQEITDRFSAGRVGAIIVWIPMLPSDNEEAAYASATMFPTDRAIQFYDAHQSLGLAYTRAMPADFMTRARKSVPAGDPLAAALDAPDEAERPQWDLYMLYAPGVRWEHTSRSSNSGPPMPTHWIRHCGRRDGKVSTYWRDSPDTPPQQGDLFEAMRSMADQALATPASPPHD